MSIAKRDKGKNSKNDQRPSNEDEGSEAIDPNRFARTNQAIKWAKGGIADAKLYLYAKTGQIEESLDSPDVAEALQKLDTYKEQIHSLLTNAENWTMSMLQTWNHQKALIESLNEANTVIHTFRSKTPTNATVENKGIKASSSIATSDDLEFVDIVKGISTELYFDQQESEKRYGQASALLVVPLRNILDHEIQHAVDIKRKYISHKRQYDNCCTTITHFKHKIEEIENPQSVPPESEDAVSTFGKIKMGFGKLIASAQTKQELQMKLSYAREELPQFMKQFELIKQQLLEAVNIVEEKLNIEVVYYVQQFYSFVLKWKSGSIQQEEEQQQQEIQEEEMKEDKTQTPPHDVVVQEIEKRSDANDANDANVELEYKDNKNEEQFVADLQIDSMINNPADLDEVSLGSNEDNNNNDDVAQKNKENDDEIDNENDGRDMDEIEISENHDIET